MIFDEKLLDALKKAKLPENPAEIIGHIFYFYCEHGSHYHSLTGIITGIDVSDEGFFPLLYVSIPRLWGAPLRGIYFNCEENKWFAFIGKDGEEKESLGGLFYLL